jgi:hypothetical protein
MNLGFLTSLGFHRAHFPKGVLESLKIAKRNELVYEKVSPKYAQVPLSLLLPVVAPFQWEKTKCPADCAGHSLCFDPD